MKALRNHDLNTAINKHVRTPDNIELTLANFHALEPAVIKFALSSASAILVPSTTRSATTGSSGFLEHATFWTHHVHQWCSE